MSSNQLRIQRKLFSTLTTDERDAWAQLLRESTTSRWAFVSPTYAEAVNTNLGPWRCCCFGRAMSWWACCLCSELPAGWDVWACGSR